MFFLSIKSLSYACHFNEDSQKNKIITGNAAGRSMTICLCSKQWACLFGFFRWSATEDIFITDDIHHNVPAMLRIGPYATKRSKTLQDCETLHSLS